MRGTRKWIILFSLLCIACLVVWYVFLQRAQPGVVAQIRQDGVLIRTVALTVSEPYEFTVYDSSGGENRIRVEKGKIAVVEANCPDRVCVHQGFIGTSAVPIVCLPHRLVITVIGETEDAYDAVTGGA